MPSEYENSWAEYSGLLRQAWFKHYDSLQTRETDNKMLHKSLPTYPRESNFVLLLYSVLEYSKHPASHEWWWIPSGWGKAQGSEVKCICQRHWLRSCLTCWFFLLQTLWFPRIHKKLKVRLLQKYFLGLKSEISFQALCCTLAAGPETIILHSSTGCTQCLKLTQN